jgi:hypothetical protein
MFSFREAIERQGAACAAPLRKLAFISAFELGAILLAANKMLYCIAVY